MSNEKVIVSEADSELHEMIDRAPMGSGSLIATKTNSKKTVKHIALQAIPNPEKPGTTIRDAGVITEYTGGGVIETEGCMYFHKLDDKISIEKAKVLRGFTSEALTRLGFHIVETTIVSSGKKQYAIIKQGPLKALLKKHEEYLNELVV